MVDNTTGPSLRDMSGLSRHTILLKSLSDDTTLELPLAAPTPQDFSDAKDFIVRDRTKKVIQDTNGLLDPDTRAKMIAEVRSRTESHTSVLLDIDGITYMHFLMAKRGGYQGHWDGFRMSLQGADFRKLQTTLFDLCGIEVDAKPEGQAGPLDREMIGP